MCMNLARRCLKIGQSKFSVSQMSSKPIDDEDEFEEFEQEGTLSGSSTCPNYSQDWDAAPTTADKNWAAAWEDAEWDDADPDDSFQQRLKEEIQTAIAKKQHK